MTVEYGPMRDAWVLSCGTELTSGATVDTNAAWLSRQLAALGVRVERHVTLPDAADPLRDALLEAARAADVIVVTGGLGPTSDDLTRQALADATGQPLVLDGPSLERLRAYFAARNLEMPETNRVQAMVPRSGRPIQNLCGTAPGVAIDIAGTPCYALPGVPFEMKDMFTREVAPEVLKFASGDPFLTRILLCFGLGESDLGGRLRDLMAPGRNPAVGTTAELGVIGVRLSATGRRREAEALLGQTEREIRARLGEVVFGSDDDTLSSVVGGLLASAGLTLSTAESCTGGLIGTLLTDVSGSSRYYLGGVVSYANQAKQDLLGVTHEQLERHGAVSAPVARAMAAGVRERFAADYALSVTGIAGPTGGSPDKPVGLTYIGLASARDVSARAYHFGGTMPRQVIRMRAAHTALNTLRRELLRTQPRS